MGWDVSLTINTGYEEYEVIDIGNYTYNVAPIFEDALGFKFRELHDMRAEQVVSKIKNGIFKLENNPDYYRKMNPKNGWGDYEGGLEFLQNIYNTCLKHPLCTLKIY